MTTIQGFIALDTAKNEKPCAGNRKNKQLYHMSNNNSPLKTFIPQSRPSLPTLTCPDTLLNLKKKKKKARHPARQWTHRCTGQHELQVLCCL